MDLKQHNGHSLSVLSYECDIAIEGDLFFAHMVEMARDVYGEYLLSDLPEPDPSVASSFDLGAIQKAIREGMPDPDNEATKPENLRNYRSEAAELVARKALSDSYGFVYPAAAQVVKGNAVQPILGFDGWGLIELEEDSWAFVVIQVKGSDEDKSPPTVVSELIQECKMAPNEPPKLCRAITSILALVSDQEIKNVLLRMLEKLGQNKPLKLIVAPVVVRGKVHSCMDDIMCFADELTATENLSARASSTSIGVELATFGYQLFDKARSHD